MSSIGVELWEESGSRSSGIGLLPAMNTFPTTKEENLRQLSPPAPVLIKTIQRICGQLSLISYVRAINVSSETAHLKPGSSPPTGEGKELAHWFAEMFEKCGSNWDRLLVIRDAQSALRHLRYSPEKALVHGTREWKLAIARDKRVSVEVACAYAVSSSYVRQLRVALRAGKLDEKRKAA